jgi:hypothetical protein
VGRWRRPSGIAAAALLSLPAAAPAAPPFPSDTVRIVVSVDAPGSARVDEEYGVAQAVEAATFELLERPCATAGPIAATVDGRPLRLEESRRGPWTILRASNVPSGVAVLRYSVRLAGDDASVPIVVPAAPLQQAPQSDGADVALHVVFATVLREATVALPRLDRSGDGLWRAHLLAIPSVVVLRLPPRLRTPCGRALAGTTGGLEWRFWIFVATMGAWIPVYFWWFGRRDDSA